MSYNTTEKQRNMLKDLGCENIPDDGEQASKLIGELLEAKKKSGSDKPKKSGYQQKTIEVIIPEDVHTDEPSRKEYLQKFVTAHFIVTKDLFPSIEVGTTDYFIKVYATVHDL